MKISYGWLLDHLDTEASVDKIAETLTSVGLEVEDIAVSFKELATFEVAQIIEAAPHPQADKLQICKVKRGTGEILQIVCGAPNARIGLKTALALPGCHIPAHNFTIKNSVIRGVESFGMLCSASELGLDTESSGILELDDAARVGDSLLKALDLEEYVFEINVTPNRSDCLSVRGVARELAAAGIGNLKPLPIFETQESNIDSPTRLIVDSMVQKSESCTQFAGRIITGVINGPSPLWLQKKLKALGKVPVSLCVDVTNFICFDLGRPLHAFDYDQIQGNVHVRFAKEAEKFHSLKDISYTLNSEMLVVADDQKSLALAGVMGGMSSSCTPNTTNIFLESACFNASRTAATGRTLNILSDARYRFERGVDPSLTLMALEYATCLIQKYGGGTAEKIMNFSTPIMPKKIEFDPKEIEKKTGIQLPKSEIDSILKGLGFSQQNNTLAVPAWRHDVQEKEDVVEEIVRHYGYEKIPEVPLDSVLPASLTKHQIRAIKLRHALSNRGLKEVVTWSMVDKKSYDLFDGKTEDLRLVNPITLDLEYMRPSILPNLLKAISRNADRKQKTACLFEIGSVYKDLQTQETVVAMVRWGNFNKNHWINQERGVDVFDIKADVEDVLETCGLKEGTYQIAPQTYKNYYHPGRSGVIQQGPKNILGAFGEVHPGILKQYDIKNPVMYAELRIGSIPHGRSIQKDVLKLSPFPVVERDFAFVVPTAQEAGILCNMVKKIDPKVIKSVDIFDVYPNPWQGQTEQKSIGLRVVLEPQTGTFTDAEIQNLCQQIIRTVEEKTGGKLRADHVAR